MAPPGDKKCSADRLVVAAAQALLDGQGDFDMASVARRAGVSVGLAYHYFASKAGLVAAVVDAFHEELDACALMAHIDIADWHARERARTQRSIRFHLSHPLSDIVLGKLRREPRVLEIERGRHARQLAQGTRNMRDGQRQGAVAAELDPAQAAAFVLAGVRALIAQALDLPRAERPSVDELSESAWHFVQRAVGVPAATVRGQGNAARRRADAAEKSTRPHSDNPPKETT